MAFNENEIDKYAQAIWDYSKMQQTLEPVDAIVALGSMDLRVAERAAELWHQNLAPIIVASGGFGRLTGVAWTETEAKKFADVLHAKGVPEFKVLLEDKSTNAAENFNLSIELLRQNSINPKKLIIVTKPYMERRAYATGLKLFPNIEMLMASPEISYEDYPNAEISKDDMLNIMVGDIQRVKLYPAKGFTVPQKIPTEVEQAMGALIKQGYRQQLIKE